MNVTILFTNGLGGSVEAEHKTLFKDLYPVLECDMIEVVHLTGGEHVLLVDEDGIAHGKSINVMASHLAGQRIGHVAIMPHGEFYREDDDEA